MNESKIFQHKKRNFASSSAHEMFWLFIEYTPITYQTFSLYYNSFYTGKDAVKGVFIWSGRPRSSGVGFFCFHALGDTKQKKPTPLDRGPPLHVNRALFESSLSNSDLFTCEITWYVLMWRYHVFAQKLTWLISLVCVYIIKWFNFCNMNL